MTFTGLPFIEKRFHEVDPRWRADAACRGMDTDLFFPERGDNAGVAAARAVCRSCPVLVECQAYALVANPRGGVMGGMTERQRRKARKAAA